MERVRRVTCAAREGRVRPEKLEDWCGLGWPVPLRAWPLPRRALTPALIWVLGSALTRALVLALMWVPSLR